MACGSCQPPPRLAPGPSDAGEPTSPPFVLFLGGERKLQTPCPHATRAQEVSPISSDCPGNGVAENTKGRRGGPNFCANSCLGFPFAEIGLSSHREARLKHSKRRPFRGGHVTPLLTELLPGRGLSWRGSAWQPPNWHVPTCREGLGSCVCPGPGGGGARLSWPQQAGGLTPWRQAGGPRFGSAAKRLPAL